MEVKTFVRYWSLIHSIIQEIWRLTEPHIEEAAVRAEVPIELYYYSELGLNSFSVVEFQQRDPFSNPEKFERVFTQLEIKDWIVPTREGGQYQVPEKVRQAVRKIIGAGDEELVKLTPTLRVDLDRLLSFLKQVILANNAAPEPPEKWAIARRFRVATRNSPVIVQVRECLMDLFAYRDDSHLSAARPYFGEAGIVWSAFGSVWSGSAVTAEKIAEALAFRGYEVEDYAAALQAAVEAGWLEPADAAGAYRPTEKGMEMRTQVERLTDEYFYRPWQMFSQEELDEFHGLLEGLRQQLHGVKTVPR